MALVEIAHEVIRLAEARNAEEDAIRESCGIGHVVDMGSDAAFEYMRAPRPARKALSEYLAAQTPTTVFKLCALMYFGRGDSGHLFNLHSDLCTDCEGSIGAIHTMMEKAPLDEYLRQGVAAACSEGIQLDEDWPQRGQNARRRRTTIKGPEPVRPKTSRPEPTGLPFDPIREGGRLFKDLAERWESDVITERQQMARFLQELIDCTGGWVILDFIDLAGWDQIDGYTFDQTSGNLELYWHDNRAINAAGGREEIELMAFPASLYGLMMRLQEIRIVRGSDAAVFLLAGHATDHAEIKGQLAAGCSEFEVFPDNLFSSRAVRRWGEQVHVFDVLQSPLYTVALLPKGPHLSAAFSRRVLFDANLRRVKSKLDRAIDALRSMDASDNDAVCEKVNTIRRYWEQALKIEIVYRDLRPKKGYSGLLIGNLIKELRDCDDPGNSELTGRFIGWANELSHDAGREIKRDRAVLIAEHVYGYVQGLHQKIQIDLFQPRGPI
jgi:hypothetical protein